MPTNMRFAVGTLVAAALCALVTVVLWILPFVLSNGRDPNETGWVVLVLYSVFPAGLAVVLFIVSAVYFIIAVAGRRP
ncbi:hypothetical protein ACFQFC_16335 [Amorphoplanes digitatis]|uniref:Branched-subunit amino acid transport protein AzlD n=1 Tax=Actinoplanes digitatis TaxID=1868 RepID=A0A7W7I3Z8_9ACTN|nr:hypothetical protein [Actinoplanes digitatis]MBB4765783.1 branched-subunit amino acid transport protein AzlD [Actinoplanes digitatis]GID93425.1 hypothetical protein Adi01nite_28370 [Actinoplanes digitatis]